MAIESRDYGTQGLISFCPRKDPDNWKVTPMPSSQPPPSAISSCFMPLYFWSKLKHGQQNKHLFSVSAIIKVGYHIVMWNKETLNKKVVFK